MGEEVNGVAFNLESCSQNFLMGHVWGKKLAQNNSKPHKASIRLALMHCLHTTSALLQRTLLLN